MTHDIQLIRPDSDVKGFDRGERIIMVDGVRWGRTFVRGRGVHGNATTFARSDGSIISDGRRDVEVMSASERRSKVFTKGGYRLPDGFKNTEQRVLEKVRELVESGDLKHPDAIKAENAKLEADRAKRYEAAQARETAAFEAKAWGVVHYITNKHVELSPADQKAVVERIVTQMRWAQDQ